MIQQDKNAGFSELARWELVCVLVSDCIIILRECTDHELFRLLSKSAHSAHVHCLSSRPITPRHTDVEICWDLPARTVQVIVAVMTGRSET